MKEGRQPRHWWINVYSEERDVAHRSKQKADLLASGARQECVHVVEVLPDHPTDAAKEMPQ